MGLCLLFSTACINVVWDFSVALLPLASHLPVLPFNFSFPLLSPSFPHSLLHFLLPFSSIIPFPFFLFLVIHHNLACLTFIPHPMLKTSLLFSSLLFHPSHTPSSHPLSHTPSSSPPLSKCSFSFKGILPALPNVPRGNIHH